jgi:VWFA-related protein
MLRRYWLPNLIVILALFSAAFSQDDPINIETAIVRLNVGVVDQRGRPITDLQSSDFAVFENGVKQQITHFEKTTAPFSVVLLLDMSGSTKSFRQNIALSATRFLDVLSPEDRVAVVEFYNKINLLNGFTTDRSRIAHSISVANGSGDTDLYKAIDFALNKLAAENSRRKAIVVLTDGVDTKARDKDRERLSKLPQENIAGSLNIEENSEFVSLLDKADRLGVTIYPLALPTGDPNRLADPTPLQIEMYRAARERLKFMANRTGGRFNAVNRLEEMGRLYAEVAADLRTLYTLEYQPKDPKRDGKWREIKISVSDPTLIARSRLGYYAK